MMRFLFPIICIILYTLEFLIVRKLFLITFDEWKRLRSKKPNIVLFSNFSTKYWIFGLCFVECFLFLPLLYLEFNMMSNIISEDFVLFPLINMFLVVLFYGGSVKCMEDMKLTPFRIVVDSLFIVFTLLLLHFEVSNVLYIKGNDIFSEKEFLKEEVIFKSYSGDIETVVLPKVPADCVNRDDVSFPYRNCLSVIEVLSGAKFRHFSSRSISHAKIKLENVKDDKVTLYFRLGYYGVYVFDN